VADIYIFATFHIYERAGTRRTKVLRGREEGKINLRRRFFSSVVIFMDVYYEV
jgi:hypothetical protein